MVSASTSACPSAPAPCSWRGPFSPRHPRVDPKACALGRILFPPPQMLLLGMPATTPMSRGAGPGGAVPRVVRAKSAFWDASSTASQLEQSVPAEKHGDSGATSARKLVAVVRHHLCHLPPNGACVLDVRRGSATQTKTIAVHRRECGSREDREERVTWGGQLAPYGTSECRQRA